MSLRTRQQPLMSVIALDQYLQRLQACIGDFQSPIWMGSLSSAHLTFEIEG